MKRADRRKYHYIYKITRFDGKYYIGLHSTDNLEDGYFGSGKYLKSSIRYHGIDKHTKEIVEFLPCRSSLKQRELELVTEECINDPLCMNLKLGGEGGWDHVSIPLEERRRNGQKGGNIHKDRLANDEKYREEWLQRESLNKKELHSQGVYTNFKCDWSGRTHREETKLKIGSANSKHQQGENNSQFGTCWITKDGENKKVSKDELEDYLNLGWVTGRKIKHLG
jgi:hypothetical protein